MCFLKRKEEDEARVPIMGWFAREASDLLVYQQSGVPHKRLQIGAVVKYVAERAGGQGCRKRGKSPEGKKNQKQMTA